MPRRQAKGNGVRLPHALQQELGLQVQSKGRGGRQRNAAVWNRKLQRKAGRIEKRAARAGRGRQGRQETVQEEVGDDGSSESDGEDVITAKQTTRTKNATPKAAKNPQQKLESILTRPVPQESSGESEGILSDRDSSPGLVLDSTSRTFKIRAAQDDANILALEKKLGLKHKTGTKSFEDGGFGDLLEGLDSGDESSKRKREVDEWLEKKRRKGATAEDEKIEQDDRDSTEGSEEDEDISDLEDANLSGEDAVSSVDGDADSFAGFESDEGGTKETEKVRENPYVAPVASTTSTTIGKYIPPSLRKRTEQDSESLTRLQRQMRGHLNKLSEANLISILKDIESLYQSHARQDVTSTLIDLLLSQFCDRSILQNTFVILHAAFIAAVYKVIGTDFGAELVSKLTEHFDRFYSEDTKAVGKETVNLVSLLCHLYAFHVISSTLVFDYIRMWLQDLSELNTELLLKAVRDCGPQLRQDDPSSLKSIVQIMQNATAKITADGRETSVRTKFMIETITDLKNNKMKAAAASSGVAIEHITQMRKVLGSLNTRNLRASEPLRIGLNDIKDSDKKGRWWLVGASWKGNEPTTADLPSNGNMYNNDGDMDSQESDLLALARQYRMNTDVRRSIFVAIMSASDWQDAYLRLMKLRLKRSQEQEIPKVLLRCAGAEAAYNPYYTLITKKLCLDKRLRMAFQFVLWDFFKKMGEKGDTGDEENVEEEQGAELTEIINLAKMYGYLIADGALGINVLRTLNLAYLKDPAKMFVELLLIVILTHVSRTKRQGIDENRLSKIFRSAGDTPELVQGLQYFLKKFVRHSDLVAEKETLIIKRGCKAAFDFLTQIAASQGGHG
jgi:nucleolar MIF4G domain-containing protein 1